MSVSISLAMSAPPQVHTNSLCMNGDGAVYVLSRNLDTVIKVSELQTNLLSSLLDLHLPTLAFLQVDIRTPAMPRIVWGVGRFGKFKLYDENGQPTQSLFYAAHGLACVGEGQFAVFDNDVHNVTSEKHRPAVHLTAQMMETIRKTPISVLQQQRTARLAQSRVIVFSVDETEQSARITYVRHVRQRCGLCYRYFLFLVPLSAGLCWPLFHELWGSAGETCC